MKAMENKKKAIEKAYGEHWEAVKDYVDENGFVDSIHFPHGRLDADFGDNNGDLACDFYIRPLSLQGIETNNGWIKIESEDDLPKEDCQVFINHFDFIYTAFFDSDEKEFSSGIIPNIKPTHYQPIEKPKPPIY